MFMLIPSVLCLIIALFAIAVSIKLYKTKKKIKQAPGIGATKKEVVHKINFASRISNGVTIVFIAASVMCATIAVNSTIETYKQMASAGSLVVNNFYSDNPEDEEKKNTQWNWSWDEMTEWTIFEEGEEADDYGDYAGGITLSDPILQKWYDFLSVTTISVNAANQKYGTSIPPEYTIGVYWHEMSNDLANLLNSSEYTSVMNSLIPTRYVCSYSTCGWHANNKSHFYGGTASGAVDKGDPYNRIIENIDGYKTPGNYDHSVGLSQPQTEYVYNTYICRVYPNIDVVVPNLESKIKAGSDRESSYAAYIKMDTALNFVRPNVMYLPDIAMDVSANRIARGTGGTSDARGTAAFKKLDTRNQSFIRMFYGEVGYNAGSFNSTDHSIANKLIALVTSGRVKYLDEMADSIASQIWDSEKMVAKSGFRDAAVKYVNSTYGLGIPTGSHTARGVNSVLISKVIWGEVMKKVAASSGGVGDGSGDSGGSGGNGGSGSGGGSGGTGGTGGTGGGSNGGSVVTGTTTGDKVLAFCMSKIGCGYDNDDRYGPRNYDCSGLVYMAIKSVDPSLARAIGKTSVTQAKYCYDKGYVVSKSAMKPGDLIFYSNLKCKEGGGHCGRWKEIHHVAVYQGNGLQVHARNKTVGVQGNNPVWKDDSKWVFAFAARPYTK